MVFDHNLACGPLHYIPVALSTLKPSTSPHLSDVQLRLTGPTHPHYTSENWNLENMGDDVPRIAEESSRIEREYEGVVDLRVFRGAGFERYDTLNVRFFISVESDETSLRDCRLVPRRSFSVGIVEMGSMDNPSHLFPQTGHFTVELFGHDRCRSSIIRNEELAPVVDQRRVLPSSCLPRKAFPLKFHRYSLLSRTLVVVVVGGI